MTRKDFRMLCISEAFFTNKFTTMTPTAQALLVQLWGGADDEGVNDAAYKTVQNTIARRASRKPAWQELIDNGYIIVSDKPEFTGYAYIVGFKEANSGKRWKKETLHKDFLKAIGKESTIETTKRPAVPANKPGKPLQGAAAITRDNQEGPDWSQLEQGIAQRQRARAERQSRRMVVNDTNYLR